MKHNMKITLLLVLLFLISQFLGIIIMKSFIQEELPFGVERPVVEESYSWAYIVGGVIIGTMLLLLIIKFRKKMIWKTWFFLSVFLCLTVAISAFVDEKIAIVVALIAAGWKVFKPNVLVHNITEVFIYGGLAAIFVTLMNIWSASILLILISIYDMIAVWKIKHMITLAKFQTESKVFAGVFIPYNKDGTIMTKSTSDENEKKTSKEKGKKTKTDKKEIKLKVPKYVRIENANEKSNAVLGGGDIAFPLLFSGAIMKAFSIQHAFVISLTSGAALFLLLYYSQKGKFYPAMPFISVGCFIGLGIAYLM